MSYFLARSFFHKSILNHEIIISWSCIKMVLCKPVSDVMITTLIFYIQVIICKHQLNLPFFGGNTIDVSDKLLIVNQTFVNKQIF